MLKNSADNEIDENDFDILPEVSEPIQSGNFTVTERNFLRDMESANVVAEKLEEFAKLTQILRPFTKQLGNELKDAYPEDLEIYSHADKVQKAAAKTYFLLRTITFSTFIGFLISSYLVLIKEDEFGVMDTIPFQAGDFLLVTGAALFFSFFRVVSRWVFLKMITQNRVQSLGFEIAQKQSDLERKMNSASGGIALTDDPQMPNLDWETRAFGQTKILLWYAKKLEALDRYATTVIWKMDQVDLYIERGFVGLKVIFFGLMLVTFAWPENRWQNLDINAIFCMIFIGTLGFLFWWFVGRLDTHYWRDTLVRNVKPGQGNQRDIVVGTYYFDVMAVRNRDLVSRILLASRMQTRRGANGKESS
jgi:hypothetical protein